MEKRECVCFAYYIDDVFIGWYGDTFGSVCKSPKIYGRSESQLSTIRSNFMYKMQRVNESSFEQALASAATDAESIRCLIFSDEKALRGRNVELRMVACPVYDGPNPEFNKEEYDKYMDERMAKMRSLGIFDMPAGSMDRILAITEFEKTNPVKTRNSWIYANQEELEAWLANEPTEFLMTFKYINDPKPKKHVVEKENGDVENETAEEMPEES